MRPRRIWLGLTLIIIVGLVIWNKTHSAQPKGVTWLSSNPLMATPHSRPLTFGPPGTVHTIRTALPPGQIPQADWLLPLTASSSIGYVLHDAQARWVIHGQAKSLQNAPANPNGSVIFQPGGRQIGWVLPTGGMATLQWPALKIHTIPHATGGAFLADGTFRYVFAHGGQTVIQGGMAKPNIFSGNPAATHPLIRHGRDVVLDNRGRLQLTPATAYSPHVLATINPRNWPTFQECLSFGPNVAMLLSRTTPAPAYLLIIHEPHQTLWYRWQSALIPELGLVKHHLMIEGLNPPHQVAIIGALRLHSLNVPTEMFSSGPMGVIWRGPSGFERIVRISP